MSIDHGARIVIAFWYQLALYELEASYTSRKYPDGQMAYGVFLQVWNQVLQIENNTVELDLHFINLLALQYFLLSHTCNTIEHAWFILNPDTEARGLGLKKCILVEITFWTVMSDEPNI